MRFLCAVHVCHDTSKLFSEYDCVDGLNKYLDHSDHTIVGEFSSRLYFPIGNDFVWLVKA